MSTHLILSCVNSNISDIAKFSNITYLNASDCLKLTNINNLKKLTFFDCSGKCGISCQSLI